MFCILTVATSSMFENYLKLVVFTACFLQWQIRQTAGSCPVDWVSDGTACYKVVTSQNEPFSDVYSARQTCMAEGGDLTSLEGPASEALVYQLMINASSSRGPLNDVYIGMTDILVEGNFTWLNGDASSYTNFSASHPDDAPSLNGADCVAIHSTDSLWRDNGQTSWIDVPCCFRHLNISAAACRKPMSANISVAAVNDTMYQKCYGECPKDWYKFDGHCYGLLQNNSATTFNDTYSARQTCQQNAADVAVTASQNVSQHINNVVRQHGGAVNGLYIGLSRHGTGGTYQFIDRQAVGYSNWLSGEPSGQAGVNCVMLDSQDGSWTNSNNLTGWKAVDCCGNQSVSYVMCAKPEHSAAATVHLDNDVFADECYGHFNECISNPCQNGATCKDHVLHYQCDCVPGYTGVHCETQIDYCKSSPCQNGGTCATLVNAYSCSCTPGYNDTNCNNLYDHCLAFEPCQNGATCINQGNHSECSCVVGFTGQQCETNIDECQNTTCLNNGTCVDQIGSAYCSCLLQFTGPSCETEVKCSPDHEVVNATKIWDQQTVIPGKNITYRCNPGHKFPDMAPSKTIVCTVNGWSPDVTTLQYCEAHCNALPDVSNAMVPNANSRVGTVLNYTCYEGFQMQDNSTDFNITCLPGGNWSIPMDQVPQCEIVNCPDLVDYNHQTLDTTNTTYNTTVTFWCDVGYVLHDNTTARTIKCLSDGQWTATLPPCEPVRCPVIDQPADIGWTRNTSMNTYDTYAQYSCNSGLRMRDGATYRIIKCDATAEWSDNITECRGDRCFPLPFVANSTPSTTDAMFGSRVILTCIEGHRFFSGSNPIAREKEMKCLNISRWDPLLAACEPLYCPALPGNVNSQPNTTNSLFGTVVDVRCDLGHYYPDANNSVIMTCIDNVPLDRAEWSVNHIDPCWPTVCEAPPTVTNGTQLDFPPNTNYSTEVRYFCLDGFKFIDGLANRTLRCNEFGRWNQTDVSCKKQRCDPVPVAYKAVPDTTNTSWTTVVTYKCAIGHHWPNNVTRRVIQCDTGTWVNTTNIPDCIINECPPVSQYPNTTIANDSLANVYDTVISYECDPGFKYPDGSLMKTRRCDHTQVWLPTDFPACEITYCPTLSDVENATRNTNDTAYDTTVTYTCDSGYQFPDKTLSKPVYCTANETWTPYPAPCEVVFCPPIPYWDADFNSTDNNFLSVVTYMCKSGDAFKDSNKDPSVEKMAKCLESKVWDPPIEQCLPMNSIAKDLQGVAYESEDSVPIGTIACSLMCLMLAAVILLDLNKIYQDLKMMKNNIGSLLHSDNKVTDSSADIKDAAESTA